MNRNDRQLAQEVYAGLQSAVMIDRILAIHILGDSGDEQSLNCLQARLSEVCAEEEALHQAILRLEKRLREPQTAAP